jgi:hypothetical protein
MTRKCYFCGNPHCTKEYSTSLGLDLYPPRLVWVCILCYVGATYNEDD